MKIDSFAKSRISTFCRDHEIDLFIIFGSFFDRKIHRSSDIDIALLIKNPSKQVDKPDLIFELENISKRRDNLVI